MRTFLFVVVMACTACSRVNPAAPPPPVPLCQTQNTAEVSLRNTSPNGLTFDVLIDNIARGTMAVGQTVGPVTVTAGVAHTIVSRVTNTAIIGCTSSTSFAQCSSQTLTCSY
jgi:hypothetical protein